MSMEQGCLAITIIVPVWNGERDIERLLTRLGNQTADRSTFEVIVVDNGSSDQTCAVVESFDNVILLSEAKPGSYRARNRAIARAQASFLLFTDADCVPAEDWVERGIDLANKYGGDCLIGGRVELFRVGQSGRYASRYDELAAGFNQEWNLANGRCVTANWLCSKALLERVGLFNENLLSGGDGECAARIDDAGAQLVYAPELLVRHPTRASIGELVRKKRRVMGGRWEKSPDPDLFRLSRSILQENIAHARWAKGADFKWSEKVGVFGIIGLIYAASQAELVRLKLGFAPYRS